MATGATGQLGLALPVQGELSGTWGDTVNNGITQYTNLAIAATLTLTDDGAVTLANTTGDAAASNITSTLAGAGTVTAQFAIVRISGTLTTTKVVTAPSYSKTYVVVNAATGGAVTFKASGQTGISVAVGESAYVYYNGTDYVKLTSTSSGAAGGSTTQVQYNNAGALAGSSGFIFDGTNLKFASGAGLFPNTSDASDTGTLAVGGGGANSSTRGGIVELYGNENASPGVVDITSGNVANSYVRIQGRSSTSYVRFDINASEVGRFDSTGLGIGTNSPANKLHVNGTGDSGRFQGASRSLYIATDANASAIWNGAAQTGEGVYLNAASNLLDLYTNSTVKFRVGPSGQLGIGGATYCTAGQVLTSGGPSAAPTWAAGGGGGSSTGANLYLAVNFGGF